MAGVFILSLDTEIAWGTAPEMLSRYAACFDSYRPLLRRLVALLDTYDIPATWAVVGHLFLRPGDPRALPRTPEHWYHGPDVIEAIRGARARHEIGTHTFAHVYTRHTLRPAWEADLALCAALHREHDLPLRSLVFPQNQVGYLDSLPRSGIVAYRGIEGGRAAERRGAAHLVHRALALPPPTYNLSTLRDRDGLVNLPASQFLLAYDGVRGLIPTEARVAQARRGLAQATRHGHLFHLWFHPFNLGTSPRMFEALEAILREVARHRDAGTLETLTMADATIKVLASTSK